MARRSYEQYCSLARALDVVGERWTLLVIRELMLGPRRFKDLLDGLPGVGRNLLAARLRHLEREALLTRRDLPAPAGSRVYELTEDGHALGPALAELSRWGVARLEPPRPGMTFRPEWAMFPLSYMADQAAARGVQETYQFHVGAASFHLRVDDGAVEPRTGEVERPDLVVRTGERTMLDLFSGALTALDALAQGRVVVEGPPESLARAVAILAGPADA